MRRHDVDLPRGAQAQLDARAAEVLPADPLLHDPALLVERREVLLDVDLLVLELDRLAQVASAVEVEQRVPETADAEVELEDGLPGVRAARSQLVQGGHEILRRSHVEPDRVPDVLLGEHLPAPGLRPQPPERGVASVDRELQRLGETDLLARHAEGDDHRHLGLPDEPPDPCDRAGSSQELPRQGLVAPVDERHRLEAATRLGRVQLGEEREVIVDDTRVNRL